MKNIILAGSLSLNVILLTVSCGHRPDSSMPKWNGALWAGNSEIGGLKRTQSNQELSCLQPQMDNMVCMSYKALECLYSQLILNCSYWKDPTLQCNADGRSAKAFIRSIQ